MNVQIKRRQRLKNTFNLCPHFIVLHRKIQRLIVKGTSNGLDILKNCYSCNGEQRNIMKGEKMKLTLTLEIS